MFATMDGKYKVEVKCVDGRWYYFQARGMRWLAVASKRLEF